MAIAFDVASTQIGTTASTSWSHVCSGSDRILIVGVSILGEVGGVATSVSSVTYNGVALTKLVRKANTKYVAVELWYLLNPATGSNTVVVNFDAAKKHVCSAVSYTGVDSTLGNNNTGSAGNTAVESSSTTVSSASGELVVDVHGIVNHSTETPNAGQTERWNANNGTAPGGCGSEEAGAASVTMGWTWSVTRYWAQILLCLKPKIATITAGPGSYSLGGQTTSLFYDRVVSIDPGSYALSGQAMSPLSNRVLSVDTGSYALSGQEVATLYNRLISIGAGSYALSGQTASLLFDRVMSVGSDSYALSGQNASFLFNRVLSALAGAYVLTGQDVALIEILIRILKSKIMDSVSMESAIVDGFTKESRIADSVSLTSSRGD